MKVTTRERFESKRRVEKYKRSMQESREPVRKLVPNSASHGDRDPIGDSETAVP